MVTVLGPLESLKKNVEDVVEKYKQENPNNLRVVINNRSSIQKIIQRDCSLPEQVRSYAIEEEEVAVQQERSLLGMKRYKTVVVLAYPYRFNCVIVSDERYNKLGEMIRNKISDVEKRAIDLWFM